MSTSAFLEYKTFNKAIEKPESEFEKSDEVYNVERTEIRKKRRATSSFMKNEEEKRMVLELMKQEELIWNKHHELHLNIGALSAAWKRIAEKMPGMAVSDCKVIWKSLKDALRYRKKVVDKEKSDKFTGEHLSEDSIDDKANELEQMFSLLTSPKRHLSIKEPVSSVNNEKKTIKKIKPDIKLRNKTPMYDKNKRRLILLVKKEDLIWNKKHKLHCNHEALNDAWDRIASEMHPFSVMQCKIMWKSIQDALRYRKNIAIKKKSDDVNGETKEQHLKEIKREKCTLSTSRKTSKFSANTSLNTSVDNFRPISNCPLDNKEEKEEIYESLGTISKAISEMANIAVKKESSTPKPSFRYEYIWRLIESLYVQMDETDINQLNQQIINLVYEKSKSEHC